MLGALRTRFTYANVVATAALVFAMSGGALAATHYLVTSTKQIKPSVLSSLKGQRGAKGPAGERGSQGPQGEGGKAGTNGTNGANGTNGTNGEPGSPWTAGGTLPANATETGAWAVTETAGDAENGAFMKAPVSFGIPLATVIANPSECGEEGNPECNAVIVTVAEQEAHTAPAACKGSVADPTAAPGHFCAYVNKLASVGEGEGEGLTETEIHSFVFSPAGEFVRGTGTSGAMLYFAGPREAEVLHGQGTWAVTG
jgi:Collagen triple helix repeat (20 copies)